MVAFLIVALIILAFDILVYFFGVDSRPGFSDGRTNYKDDFFHSRR